jgi:hypothetical protein
VYFSDLIPAIDLLLRGYSVRTDPILLLGYLRFLLCCDIDWISPHGIALRGATPVFLLILFAAALNEIEL